MRAKLIWNVVLGGLVVTSFLLLWKLLEFTGITALLPLFGGWVKNIGLPPVVGHVTAVTLLVVVLGLVGRVLRVLSGSERRYIPIVSQVLSAEEQLRAFIGSDDGAAHGSVVLVDSPNREVRTLGIITAKVADRTSGRDLAIVYMLTTLNPTGGVVRTVDREKLTVTDLSIADACRICFSRGIGAPRQVEFAPPAPPSDLLTEASS